MRVLVIIVLLIVVAIGLGWLVISRNGDSVNVRVNTQKVESDADRLIDGAKDVLSPKESTTTATPAPTPAPSNP